MKIELSNAGASDFPWGLVVIAGIVWLGVLYRILTRNDFDTLAKILWVIVVIFVPIFGVILYWAAAPTSASIRAAAEKGAPTGAGGDVAGTPWERNPGFTNDE